MIFKKIQADIDAFMARDPAARSRLEVFLCYPGFHAIMWYRLSHWLWERDWHLTGRLVSHLARVSTGIEIHPGARIGNGFVIDHGSGIVIGETAVIGNDVTLYHDVTLGGIAPSVDSERQRNVKRHPTLHDGVIVGSGAQVLGPIEVGEGARVGANAVVHKDVPAGVTAVGIPARIVMPRDRKRAGEFVAYGEPVEGVPDPVLRTLDSLRGQVAALMDRVEELEGRLGEAAADQPAEGAPVIQDKKAPVVVTGGKP
ncbi:MAG: serine O-acetyltransferase [Rhodobacterales bacterium]|nr:serine O-acetyltransferase [Rhodobacterales bacterium]